MANKIIRRITALSMAAMLLLPLSACALPKAASKDTEALTWVTWDGYSGFPYTTLFRSFGFTG